MEDGTEQPLEGNKLSSKAASSTGFESCRISANQSSNGGNSHHHKEVLTNKKNSKDITHAVCSGPNKLRQAPPS
jgi:hypothetical protein